MFFNSVITKYTLALVEKPTVNWVSSTENLMPLIAGLAERSHKQLDSVSGKPWSLQNNST